jgi:hypothetical protein
MGEYSVFSGAQQTDNLANSQPRFSAFQISAKRKAQMADWKA